MVYMIKLLKVFGIKIENVYTKPNVNVAASIKYNAKSFSPNRESNSDFPNDFQSQVFVFSRKLLGNSINKLFRIPLVSTNYFQ